ncbi:DUF655 domain-containing protein [Candidatus Woesearchaeota archaeon]|uniref:DNA-binding protein n=1 Tax=Candidatus Veblenbacteria bacterium RIFOXYC1_FULL_42_9 TaxID=1802427 RepID=A0A1G2Q522_9BACT|nr:DUF655 domain-containing protein [Candidatus Woesearchaeota archaeon]OHA54981.1 MAG: DNA-binding protein [Candidatus Veblenbacteria bacterium RIFOXYC1_FULL_42_9]
MLRNVIKEENAIILDFLQHGHAFDSRPGHLKTPIAQAIGKKHFVLLELVPKKGVFLQPLDEVYIGEGKRDQIHHIYGKVAYDKLTETAKAEAAEVIKEMVKKDEKKFVDFFNKAGPISTRMHQIELIPGVGKKHMWDILEKRQEKEFDSFEDIKKRVKLMSDPEKAIVKRIISELKGEDRYKIFIER